MKSYNICLSYKFSTYITMSSYNTNFNNFGGSICHSFGNNVVIGVTPTGGLVTINGNGSPSYGYNRQGGPFKEPEVCDYFKNFGTPNFGKPNRF